MSGIGRSLYDALNRSQLLVFTLAVLGAETLVRIGLAWQFSSLLLVVWPPVIAALAFGLAHAHVRGRRFGAEPVVGLSQWLLLAVILLAIAVLGHLFALCVGGALFVIVDTPLRAVWYYLGIELFQWPAVTLGLSVLGFAVGVSMAWAVPEVLVGAVTGGMALRSAPSYLLTRRKLIDRVAFLNMLVIVGAAVAVLVGHQLFNIPDFWSEGTLLWPSLAVAFTTFSVVGLVPLAASALAAVRGATESDIVGTESTVSNYTGTVARLGIAVLLVVSLATAGGYARTNEIRPMDSPEKTFYDDSPEIMFTSALVNMMRVSHSAREYDLATEGDRELVREWVYDRQRRQVYRDDFTHAVRVGVGSYRIDSAVELLFKQDRTSRDGLSDTPNLYVPENPEFEPWPCIYHVDYHLDEPEVLSNSVILSNSDDEIVLRSTDVQYIAAATEEYTSDEVEEYHDGWMEVTIDTESKTLQTIEYRYEVTLTPEEREEGEDPRQRVHVRWEFSTDRPFEYPDGTESLSLDERLWELIIY